MNRRKPWNCVALIMLSACANSGQVDEATPGFSGPPTDSIRGVDDRPVVRAGTPSPPVSGGTLIVTRDGRQAVAADPDRNRISIVAIAEGALIHTVQLEAGDEPGRLVEDNAGRVHVALRRGGAVVTVDVARGTLLGRRAVCGAPRGIAHDPSADQLHVACADGQLVSLPVDQGPALRSVQLGVDLRDVVVQPDGLLVTRFKTAEVLRVGPDGSVLSQIRGRQIRRLSNTNSSGGPGAVVFEPVDADAAWRMLPRGTDEAIVLHQYALAAPISLNDDEQPATPGAPPTPAGSEPYGAPIGGCGGLVQPGLSIVSRGVLQTGAPITTAQLAVDASLSPDNRWIALAHAGTPDPGAPPGRSTGKGDSARNSAPRFGGVDFGAVSIVDANQFAGINGWRVECRPPTAVFSVSGQATAVAFNPTLGDETATHATWLVVQTREPAQLVLFRDPFGTITASVFLGGPSALDTGHELFHRDTGTGIACASCHLEGTEDGRVWQFSPIGNRRTQSLAVGLQGTAPFHWDGDMQNFEHLMDEVFVQRMGGAKQSAERVGALSAWVSQLTPSAPIRSGSDPAAARGKALFESSKTACSSCHAGAKLSNNQSAFVGTTEPGHNVQVPALVGVGYRAPFMHNGCARTLLDRFDPACGGGDAHGVTSHLGATELADLVAYLESL